jgi:DNA-binding transcriptional LysR family regulator
VDLRELECFVAVAHGLHFRRAAEELHLSPATVSEAITRLESSLGEQLFDRSTRSVALTDFGKTFLPMAEFAYGTVEQTYAVARAKAADQPSGFTVGHRGNICTQLGIACAEIQQVCGYVDVELVEISTSCQLENIRRGELDVGMVWGRVDDDAFTCYPIMRSRFIAMVPRGHRLADRDLATFEGLRSERVIPRSRAASPYLHDLVAAALGTIDQTPDETEGVKGVDNVVTQVLAGRGIGIAPDSELMDPLKPSRTQHPCVALPIVDSPVFELCLVARRGDGRKRISMLAELLAEGLAGRPQWGCQVADRSSRTASVGP